MSPCKQLQSWRLARQKQQHGSPAAPFRKAHLEAHVDQGAHVLLQHLHAALRDLAQADQRRVPLPPVRVLEGNTGGQRQPLSSKLSSWVQYSRCSRSGPCFACTCDLT